MFEFKFPDIGEGLIEGLLVKWTVKVGDIVKKNQTVAQVGTDKAVVDLPCPVGGTVTKLLYKDGDMMPVGKVIIHIDENSAAPSQVSTPVSASTPAPTSSSQSQVTPAPVASIVTQINPQIVQQVAPLSHEPVPNPITPISAKSSSILATPQVRAYASAHQVDLATVNPTGQHGEITMNDISVGTVQQIVTHMKQEAQPAGHSHDILATPSVRKLARELKIDLNSISGTGSNGHITEDDVRNASKNPQRQSTTSSSGQSTSQVQAQTTIVQSSPIIAGTPSSTSAGPVEILPMSRLRQIIAQRMMESRNKTASVTMTDNVNATRLVALREKYKDVAAKQNIKLTYLPFIAKALTVALKKHPIFNATLDDAKQQIILKKYYNIGFAADTPEGLMVPVIVDADKQSIYQLAQKIGELAQKAKDKKLSPSESSNSTCTITSVGALGVEAFTPIINYPEVAILGIGRIEDRVEAINGEMKIQKMVTLSFTFDHRVADGADAARFIQTLISYLQDPELMLMEVA